MIAIGNGTLALPRLALHRETVRALAGGQAGTPTRAERKSNGKGCETHYCSNLKACGSVQWAC
jgi:hypothetical protein